MSVANCIVCGAHDILTHKESGININIYFY